MVTSGHKVVSSWIKCHLQAPCNLHKKVVGLDIEWRPSSEPCCHLTTLHQALLPHLPTLPSFLKVPLQSPLQSQHNLHYGVKISGDAKRLKEDYGLKVAHFTDVAAMAAEDLKLRWRISLQRELASQRITLCNWELKDLTCGQVQYTCVDAYYSYKLGKLLIFDNNLSICVKYW